MLAALLFVALALGDRRASPMPAPPIDAAPPIDFAALLASSDRAPDEKLCREAADPDAAVDPVRIHCRLEAGRFAPSAATPGPGLRIAAYNLHWGQELDEQARAFLDGRAGRPDILLVSEADRGCSRSGRRAVARDLARALGMDYVFGVEFVELPRDGGTGGRVDAVCEHGNAVLSRFPLRRARLLRHAASRSWYAAPGTTGRSWGEPRLGGRATVVAEVQVGARTLHAYAVHFESAPWDGPVRDAQAAEALADAAHQVGAVVMGGDWNTHLYAVDLLVGAGFDPLGGRLRRLGFQDAHDRLPVATRGTHGPLVIDLIVARGLQPVAAAVAPMPAFRALSDHLPVWAELRW